MSEMQPAKRVRCSDEERDYVLMLLQQAHAVGRIDVDELNERQDKALVARYGDEFIPLLDDLPEGQEVVAVLRPTINVTNKRTGQVRQIPATPGQQTESFAFVSAKTILVPPGVTSFSLTSVLGSDTLDLTRVFAPGVVFIVESQSIMGGATIKIPPGVHVVDETQNVLAGNTIRRKAQGDGSNGTLVLRGLSIVGGHTVKLG